MELVFILISISISIISATNDYRTCAKAEIIDGVELSIARDKFNEMVEITMTGPSDAWFAYGFGKSVMNGMYSIETVYIYCPYIYINRFLCYHCS